jgi:hypothetical protein
MSGWANEGLREVRGTTAADDDRRAASLKAVASFPCQRIDVANGTRNSLGSPSVTVVAIGPS